MPIFTCSDFLGELKKSPQDFYLIHYSCQSLYDDCGGLSPRITSIAVTHFASEQTISFSTHAIAEELAISRENVRNRFNEIELHLLRGFNSFVRERRDKYWVHWNMRNLTYGFEHLEHRYRALGGRDFSAVPVEHRINLNDMLSDRYGADYAGHPKLKSLMELNGGLHRHFLTGQEEVEAFENNEFIKMHSSTLSKIGFFYKVIRKMMTGRLNVASRNIGVRLDKLFESRIAKIIGFVATILTIALAAPVVASAIWAVIGR